MLRTLLIVLLFIGIIIFMAVVLTLFFLPKEKLRYEECVLLQNNETGEVDCFGCANDICKDATDEWSLYEKPEIGIFYNCLATEQGCQLVE